MIAHKVEGTRTQTSWNILKNEDEQGKNPYPGGLNLIGAELTSRRRNLTKEKAVSEVPFTGTVRNVNLNDEKLKVNTLNSFKALERGFNMQKTGRGMSDSGSLTPLNANSFEFAGEKTVKARLQKESNRSDKSKTGSVAEDEVASPTIQKWRAFQK